MTKSNPRKLSLVKFKYSDIPEEYHCKYRKDFSEHSVYVYLGEIPNMKGHCIVYDEKEERMIVGYHIDHFEEITENEI